MILSAFLDKLENSPQEIEFEETIATIERLYEFCPTTFKNGDVTNPAGVNSGSCKLFAFALRHGLSHEQTLACFGRYYREDVLNNPGGDDHANIRSFMQHSWNGISFIGQPLIPKAVTVE